MTISAGDEGVELLHDEVDEESGPGNGGIFTLEWAFIIGHRISRFSISFLTANDGEEI